MSTLSSRPGRAPLLAGLEQATAGLLDRPGGRAHEPRACEPVGDRATLEVAGGGDPVVVEGDVGVVTEHGAAPRRGSRCGTAPRGRGRRGRGSRRPRPRRTRRRPGAGRAARSRPSRRRPAATAASPRATVGVGVHADEQRLVVEHLLEVRHEPLAVDGVPGEAAADVVVHAARRHRVERRRARPRRIAAPSDAARGRPATRSRLIVEGNFGAAPKPPHSAVEVGDQRLHGAVEVTGAGKLRRPAAAGAVRETASRRASPFFASSARRLRQASSIAAISCRNVRLGEVRAAVERVAVGGQEHRHRPAAAAGHRLHRVHVHGVDVGSLLAVDLDVDEPLRSSRRRPRRPRSTRGPSRGTSGTPSSRRRAGPARRARRAAANASGPHGYQSTGLSRCWRRYGEVSVARRFTAATATDGTADVPGLRPDGVEPAVDVDDLAGGGGEPVRQQGDAGAGRRARDR